MKPPHVEMVEVVTREHAEAFVADVIEGVIVSNWTIEAFEQVELVTWPEDDADAQERYSRIEDEIVARMFAAVKDAMVEAFFVAATEVIERERANP
jgi:hypothetical protein